MPPTADHTPIIGSSECFFESKPTTIAGDFIKIAHPPLLTLTRTRKSVSWAPRIALAYSITHINDMSEKDIKSIWYEQKDYKAFKKKDCKESAILATEEGLLDKERKEKKNRWEGLAVCTRRSGPKLAVQDPASTKKPARRPGLGCRQYSDSVLVAPRRRLPSPNSPTQLLRSAVEDLGDTTATRNIHRWASSSMSCVNEQVASPHANGAAASKSMTREDRRILTRHLSDSMLAMPIRLISPKREEASSDMDENVICDPASAGRPERGGGSRCSLLKKQLSDSALVKPRRGVRLLPLQQTAIKELEEDEISLLSFDFDEVGSPSSQYGIFAGPFSDSVLSIPEGYLMSPQRTNTVVEDNEDMNEGSLRTMDLESYGIDYEDEKERSLSIQDIERHCGSRRAESQQSQQGGNKATSEAETELSLSAGCFLEEDLEEDLSMLTNNKKSSPKDETGLGNQTNFLARCNDSLLLLHAGGGSWAKNLRRQQSRETRNDHSDPLLRLRAQGVRGKSLSEQVRRNRSDSTLISVDVAPLKTRKQDPKTPVRRTDPRMRSTNAAW
jgi:hypothetical protein